MKMNPLVIIQAAQRRANARKSAIRAQWINATDVMV